MATIRVKKRKDENESAVRVTVAKTTKTTKTEKTPKKKG